MKTYDEALELAEHVTLHAFSGHGSEFGRITSGEFQALVRAVLMGPSAVRTLRNGRIAYWSEQEKMVVIENTTLLHGQLRFARPVEEHTLRIYNDG